MFVRPLIRPSIEVEWDDRQSEMDGTTGRIRYNGVTVEFEQHRVSKCINVFNGPFYYGREWYSVGSQEYDTFSEMVDATFKGWV